MSPASLNGEGGKEGERSCKEGGHAYKSREMRGGGGGVGASTERVEVLGGGENHSSIASAAEMLMLIV